jgi:hypothetical protein
VNPRRGAAIPFRKAGYGKIGSMPKKKKPKRFRAVEAVKALARESIGTPRPSRIVPDRRKKIAEKHKPTLTRFLSEES